MASSPFTRRVGAAAGWATLALVAAALVCVPFAPDQCRWTAFRALPPPAVLAALAAFAVWMVATRNVERRLPVHLAAVAILFAAHATTSVEPLGDSTTWRAWALRDHVGCSELLANAIHRWVFRLGGPRALDLVAPLCGAAFAFVFLHVQEQWLPRSGRRRRGFARVLGAIALAGSGWQLVAFRGYVENTLPSLPFLLLAVGALTRHLAGPGTTRSAAFAAVWLALAAATHGVHTGAIPLLLIVVLMRHARAGEGPTAPRVLLVTTLTFAAVVAAVVAALVLLGFTIHAGHVAGGGDDHHFVPFVVPPGDGRYEFAMLDLAHLADVGNIFLLASPLLVAALSLTLLPRGRRTTAVAAMRQPALAVAGLGAAALTTIYCFDLRFPGDHDLMIAMAASLGLGLVGLLARAPRAAWPWTLAVATAAAGANWLVFGAFLPGAAAPGPADLLAVNGRRGEVVLRRGERTTLCIHLPAEGRRPFTFSIFGWRGSVPPGSPARAHGLAMAPPGAPDADAANGFVIVDPHLPGLAGHLAPPIDDDWFGAPIGGAEALGPWTLQALLRDATGRTFASNLVHLRAK